MVEYSIYYFRYIYSPNNAHMVDYSKWDNFNLDDSDCDSDTDIGNGNKWNSNSNSKASVTTLEPNSKVQIGPDGAMINSTHVTKDNSNKSVQKKSKPIEPIESMKNHINEYEFETKCDTYSWQQTKYDVSLSINISCIDEYIKLIENKQLKLIYALQCSNKHFVLKCNGISLINTILEYDIIETDKDGDSCIDWEVKTVKRTPESMDLCKLCVITLRKKSPIPNAIQWWSKIFQHEQDSVDITKIVGRNHINNNTPSFNTVWKEAHAQFQANVAAKEKIDVECDI